MYSGVLAIALLLGPQHAGPADAKPATTQAQSKGHDRQGPPDEAQTPGPVDEPEATNNTYTYQREPTHQAIPWWDHNWLGSLIAALALLINGIGLIFIYTQVKANVKSARSAARQTKLLILANRPWLLVKPTYNGRGYTFTAHNTGKSPAIITWRDPSIPGYHVPIGESLPPVPSYGYGFAEGGELLHAFWVEPGGTEEIGIFDSFEAFPQDARLLVYSAIRYRNTYDKDIHESRFCYRISQGLIALDGPYGYNNYT